MMLQKLLDRLRMLTAADQARVLAHLTYQDRTELILGVLFNLTDDIGRYFSESTADMRALLYDITRTMPGLPSLDELADALIPPKDSSDAARVLRRHAQEMAHALAAPPTELQTAGLDAAWVRARRAIADHYETWRRAIAAAQAIVAARAPVRHPDGAMQTGAKLEVWLYNQAWYSDPAVRPIYEGLVKVLDMEFQGVGYSMTASQGSGSTILSIPNIPEEGWDGALELVLSKLRKCGLRRREGFGVEFYRFEASAPDRARTLRGPHYRCSTQAYAVDLARLHSAFGSNDQEMLKAIEEKYAKEIRRNDEWFSDVAHLLDRRGAPTVGEALAQIIGGLITDGPITGPEWGPFQYGYATELLCKHLGHWLGHGESMSYLDDLKVPTHFAGSGPLLPIPGPQARPTIRFLTAEQVREEYASLRHQEAGRGDEDGAAYAEEDVQAARGEFRSYLQQANEKGLGLVTFQY
jgi:hypothetical protein